MSTAVVTGGAGFLGSHLCDYLLAQGLRVVAVDNLLTGSERNLEHLAGRPEFCFLRQDVSQPLLLDEPIHYMLHFASPASPQDYLRYPLETMKAGSLGTLHTLELARAQGAVYLLASTSQVYGDPLEHPQRETYYGNVNCVGPRGVYDEAKRFAEALVTAYHKVYAVDTKIVRIFNTYGPRMRADDGRVVPTFIAQALRGEPLSVFGDGKQTRSFCYVSDLVAGIYRLLTSAEHLPTNLGSPDERTILDVAHLVRELTGAAVDISYFSSTQDDPRVRRPDITKARQLLEWEPRVPLEEGLAATIAYFREALAGEHH